MTPDLILTIIIGILILNFSLDFILSILNAKQFRAKVPALLEDVYDENDYIKSQNYKAERFQFSTIIKIFSFVLILLFLYLEGFAVIDQFVRRYVDHPILISLSFFAILYFASDLLMTPLSYYQNFTIEEKYGFNKTSKSLFFTDKLKGWVLTIIIGGGILALVHWFYLQTQSLFWIYTWVFMAVFSIFITVFYSTLIVPLFNKQTPLEDGSLKEKLQEFASKVGFNLDQIYVIDGSKRSTKANAYFTGFGKKKRIVLYDTLIKDLSEDEILAVLAHEVGHYKKKHVIFNMVASILLTGLTLFILSRFISNEVLAHALSVQNASFHIGLIAFGLLYSPISDITGLLMNLISRKFEYQADAYAKSTVPQEHLIGALKKLSRNSYSNLTPHKAYVFMNYSHPTLLQRVMQLNSE